MVQFWIQFVLVLGAILIGIRAAEAWHSECWEGSGSLS